MIVVIHYVTGKEILKIFETLGELEWARWGGVLSDGKQIETPPFVVWRYKKPNESIEQKTIEAVNSFQGNVKWIIYTSGRNKNWVLEPERVQQFFKEGNYRVDSKADVEMSKSEPEFCKYANSDLASLADHLRRKLAR